MELKAALVDLGHKSAFGLLLKEAWNPEVAALGNSTLSVSIPHNYPLSVTPVQFHYMDKLLILEQRI